MPLRLAMKINSINCKKCQAPLAILGNTTRNKNLICHYCGTVMDFKNNFKALYNFTHIQKNNRLCIGQTLNFQNTPFTIVGYISYTNHDKNFIVYHLYSPTHGYAKLIDKDRCFIFYRKTHYLPDKNLWMLKKNNVFVSNETAFTIKSFEFCETYYAAGNLIEHTKQGKRSKHCFALSNSGDRMFYSLQTGLTINNYIGIPYTP